MDTYCFTYDGVEYQVDRHPAVPATVTGGGPWREGGRISPGREPFEHVSAACMEILRLAEREEQLESAHVVNAQRMNEALGLPGTVANADAAFSTAIIPAALRLVARVRELEARAEIDQQTIAGVLENRDAVRSIKEQLSRDVVAREEHIRQARQYLRIECGELGDNDWPDDLHLGDVIEKHLARPAAARISELEEENRRLREGLGIASSFGGGTTCPDGEPHRANCSRCDAPLKLTPPGSAA